MKILAIDPGYERLGIAIVSGTASNAEVLYSECFKTNPKDDFPKRLCAIGGKVRDIISAWSPEVLAIENLFFTNNQKTAMRVAETRGVIIFIAEESKLSISEFTPGEIKVATAGHGSASKDDVRRMVEKLVRLPDTKRLDDEVDAIAAGLTALARNAHH